MLEYITLCLCAAIALLLVTGVFSKAFAQYSQKAIVLLTFGTTYKQKVDPTSLVVDALKEHYPDVPVHIAYSSAHVVKTLQARGEEALNLPQVLAELSAKGTTHVAVQSLHVVPGLEYDMAKDIVSRFQLLPKGLQTVTLGAPLIASHTDALCVAEALFTTLPVARQDNDAVIFVGHGTSDDSRGGPGSLAYPALQHCLTEHDPLLFVGTIEGTLDRESCIKKLLTTQHSGTVWLIPLLTVLGDHAANDIFGNEKSSWLKGLLDAGLHVTPVRHGLGENASIAKIWAAHARTAFQEVC